MLLNKILCILLATLWVGFICLCLQSILVEFIAKLVLPPIQFLRVRRGVRFLVRFIYHLLNGLHGWARVLILTRRPPTFPRPENANRTATRREGRGARNRRNARGGVPPMDIMETETAAPTHGTRNPGQTGPINATAAHLAARARTQVPALLPPNHTGRRNRLPSPNPPPSPYLRQSYNWFRRPRRTNASTAAIASSSTGNPLRPRFSSAEPRANLPIRSDGSQRA